MAGLSPVRYCGPEEAPVTRFVTACIWTTELCRERLVKVNGIISSGVNNRAKWDGGVVRSTYLEGFSQPVMLQHAHNLKAHTNTIFEDKCGRYSQTIVRLLFQGGE